MLGPFENAVVTALEKSPTYRLSAIIDMATLTAQASESILKHYASRRWSLLQHPRFANLQDAGPWLFATRLEAGVPSQYDFLQQIDSAAAGAVCGWIVSALPPERLARHLSQAAVAIGPDGHPYLLRYHTAAVLRVLSRRLDLPGVHQWLAPVHHWWYPHPSATPNQRVWVDLTCADQPEPQTIAPLHLDQSSWTALAGDPLSYRLAEWLQEQGASPAFDKRCGGSRIGLIDLYLSQAREHGLSRDDDLITYVLMMARNGDQLAEAPAWKAALTATCEQRTALLDNVQQHLPELNCRG